MPQFTRKFLNLLLGNPNITLDFIGMGGSIYFDVLMTNDGGPVTYKLYAEPIPNRRMVRVGSQIRNNVPSCFLGLMDVKDFRIIFG